MDEPGIRVPDRSLCDGIEVNREHLVASSARSVGVVTALTPYLGYAQAAEIAKAVLGGVGDVRSLALATGSLDADTLDALLRPEVLANLAPASDVPST